MYVCFLAVYQKGFSLKGMTALCAAAAASAVHPSTVQYCVRMRMCIYMCMCVCVCVSF